MIDVSGVRNSWDTTETKSVFIWATSCIRFVISAAASYLPNWESTRAAGAASDARSPICCGSKEPATGSPTAITPTLNPSTRSGAISASFIPNSPITPNLSGLPSMSSRCNALPDRKTCGMIPPLVTRIFKSPTSSVWPFTHIGDMIFNEWSSG